MNSPPKRKRRTREQVLLSILSEIRLKAISDRARRKARLRR